MPAGDGSGPFGEGSQTGRGAGFCSGNTDPGYMSSGRVFFGKGFRGLKNFGWGRRRTLRGCGSINFNNNFYKEDLKENSVSEVEVLKRQSEILSQRLESMQKRIAELEN